MPTLLALLLAVCGSFAAGKLLGAIGVMEMKEPMAVAVIQQQFADASGGSQPFGQHIYITPPYIMTASDLRQLCPLLVQIMAAPLGIQKEQLSYG